MNDSSYLRFPHLSGGLITFTAEDDVWLAPIGDAQTGEGAQGAARAWRLTADQVPVAHPRLNPSATQVAWVSTREGARASGRGGRDVFTVPVDGGPVRRLTYWSDGAAAVRGWLSDDEVLVAGHAKGRPTANTWAYAVPLDGPVRELPYGPARDVRVRADGATLIGRPYYNDPAQWKRYGGGTGGKIWYSPDGAEFTRILGEVSNHAVSPMWVRDRVVFVSDHDGAAAVYSCLPDGSELRRHTDHGPYYVRNASTDGERIVYECIGELWLLESLDAEPRRLSVKLTGVRSGRDSFPVSARGALTDFTLSKDGRVLAAEVHGTVHWVPAEDGPARVLLDKPGVRARIPVVVPGTSTVLCASDEGGEDGLELIPADGGASRRIGHGAFGRVMGIAVSPDAKTAAVSCDDGRLLTVDLESGASTELARSTNYEPLNLAFSPDSAFLAWSQHWNNHEHGQIKLARLADGHTAEVTPARYDDFNPVFSKDGKYLVFLSNRTFDPVYDSHRFDLGFLPGVRPYLVTLAALTPSPFAPELDGRPVEPPKSKDDKSKGDKSKDSKDKDGKDKSDGDKKDGKDAEEAPQPVVVDFDGLAGRIVPFPVRAGHYGALAAVKDGVVWIDRPVEGNLGEARIGGPEEPAKGSLERYDLVKRKLATIVERVDDFAVSPDGKRLAYREGGALKVKASDATGDDDAVTVDLDRVRVRIDPGAQWTQMYNEAWRLMRDNYWREDMSGIDWPAMGERYRPVLDRIGSSDDFYDLLWELHGELGASHAYVIPSGSATDAARAQGLLGAELERTDEGAWRIGRILPGESAVIGARSPLAAPGVAAAVGDLIVAIDGRPVDSVHGPASLLVGKADKPVELTLRREGAQDRRVVVVPLGDEHDLRYHDVIAQRRAAVREGSGGRLGYVHVPDMVSTGWAEFNRDLLAEFSREALVVDLRENGGGHTSSLVVEKLARRVIGWDIGRRTEPNGYPDEAPRGPIIAIADEWAGSDGDIVTQALKTYGIATVVGTRTWGGVVGIDMRFTLVDGTLVTQPKFSFWFENAGWSVENYGVDPDVEVPITPQDWAAGRDPQLETAIRLALEALETRPAATPPTI